MAGRVLRLTFAGVLREREAAVAGRPTHRFLVLAVAGSGFAAAWDLVLRLDGLNL